MVGVVTVGYVRIGDGGGGRFNLHVLSSAVVTPPPCYIDVASIQNTVTGRVFWNFVSIQSQNTNETDTYVDLSNVSLSLHYF